MLNLKPDSPISIYLDEVTDQISYKPLRPSIRQELADHIEDRIESFEAEGSSPEKAQRQTLRCMGDPLALGSILNVTHDIQKTPGLALLTAAFMLIGIALSGFLQWSPEQQNNGYLYYIPGAILLLAVTFKGYPAFIRHRKAFAVCAGCLYLCQAAVILLEYAGLLPFWISYRTFYFATLLLVPVMAGILYSYRQKKGALLAVLCAVGVWVFLAYVFPLNGRGTGTVILLLGTFGTIVFMVYRGMLPGSKRQHYTSAVVALVLIGGIPFFSPYARQQVKAFLFPESAVTSTWDDAYNSVLIKELLSKTPAVGGISLTSKEMMDYGTGAWYFASRDPLQIGIDNTGTFLTGEEAQKLHEVARQQGYLPRYIHFQEDNVTLWDILPQHYHNNYLIAVCIFLFGWIPGIILIGAFLLFYVLLFYCIIKIQGRIASCMAFACGQCLLWQGVLYVLGNFGYQYMSFPNLPLISEGRISIVMNMLFLGFIFSAYRLDLAVDGTR